MALTDVDSLTFLAASYQPHCTLRLDKYIEGYHTVQLMTEGGVELWYGDSCYQLTGGAWFWNAFPGPRLRFHPAAGYSEWFHRHVAFTGALVGRWKAMGLWSEKPQPAPAGRDWGAFFDELQGQVRRSDRFGRLRAINLLEQMLLELAEAREAGERGEGGQDGWLQTVLGQLLEEETFAPDYEKLARAVGMSVSTLRRKFKGAMGGVTLHDYVLQNRVAKARTLLTETDLPLKSVAERLGYDTVYFFARQFKERAGVAPGVYRRSRQR